MPTAVYDSSYLTLRKQAKTLYAFNNAVQTARNGGNYTLVRSEQPTLQSAEVILVRKQGGCFCSDDAAGLSVQGRQTTGACGCAR
jgi:hypothetical protein